MQFMKPANQCSTIDEVRKAIDIIDQQIIELLGKRFEYVKEIIRFKKPEQDSIIAQQRYDEVIASRRKLAEKNGLDPSVIESMYRELLRHFIEEEMKLFNLK